MSYVDLVIHIRSLLILESKHGNEEDLWWRFPSPTGCREELLDPPDLRSTMTADHDVFLENWSGL
jgi:hypothetical protein